jgi:hypothetical protein
LQAVLVFALQEPTGQHAPAPSLLYVAAGQAKHCDEPVAPCVLLKVPAGHALQVVEPAALQKPVAQHVPARALLFVPAAQLAQGTAPPGLKVPAAQIKQVEELVAACALLYVPAGQTVQAVLPAALKEPTAQQTPAPALLLVFAAQGRHALGDVLPRF